MLGVFRTVLQKLEAPIGHKTEARLKPHQRYARRTTRSRESNMSKLIETMSSVIDALLPELEGIYKDLHQYPELSMQEVRTARIVADYVEKLGYTVTREVGVTGVVAVLQNGDGPTVMLRADMDALPMTETTGLPYASTVKAKDEDGVEVGVAHSCGHDMHVTWLLGVARLMAEHRNAWRGTLLAVFQPGEEVARGASSMMDDGMTKPLPEARCDSRPARDGGRGRHRRLSKRHDSFRR